jgi:GH15 family glucan-1,4-alpha-glucosidase
MEETLDHLAGYRGSRPVRIENGAYGQLQLDIYGELMDAVYLYNKYVKPIGYDGWTRLRRLVDWLCDNWKREDEGIWEVRGGRRHFVYSKVMSWVAPGPQPTAGRQTVLPGGSGTLAEDPR